MKRIFTLLGALIPIALFAQIATFPYTEDFEGTLNVTTELPNDWQETGLSTDGIWTVDNATNASSFYLTFPSHTNFAYTNDDDCNCDKSDDKLITPVFDFSAQTQMEMSFEYYTGTSGSDFVVIEISTDSASTFSPIDTLTKVGSWTNYTINLDAYTGAGFDKVAVAIRYNDDATWGYGVGVDDVSVQLPPSCFPPNTLTSSNVSANSADLNWVEQNAATEWEIEYGTSSFTQGTGTIIHITSAPPYNLLGLSAGTAYDWYVRSICGVADTSSWSTMSSFTTCPLGAICASYTAGDIATDYGFQAIADFPSTCPDTISISIPAGNRIDSISTSYDMTAANGAWMSEQVSLLHCPNTSTGESAVATGTGITAGTLSYNRSGLTFANGATGSVDIVMHAGRTYGGSGCDPSYNKVDDGTWQVVAYYSVIPPCQQPIALNATNNTSAIGTSVSLSWTDNNAATEWEIEYGTSSFTQGTGTVVNTTSNPDTLTGLTAETTYDWYVRSICGPADTSAWSSASSFTTPCVGVTATFTENYDGVSTPNLPNCWSTITPSATTIQTVTSTDHGVPIPSSPNALEINDAATDILISPPFTDLSSGLNRLRMQIAFEGGGTIYSDTLFVGVTNSQTNATSFVPLDTITMENTDGSFKEYSFHFDNPTLVGSNNFIAFSYKSAGGGYEYFIDDFNYEPIPSCIVPNNLSASNITNTSADIDWVEQNSATQWEIEYGTVGFTQGTGTTVIVNAKPHNLSGLTAYSSYDYYVRSICIAGDTSRWSPSAYTFTVGLPLAGLYTIDSTQATGGTNFQSFSDFSNVASLVGVSGPVQVNVAPGIYYDQLSLYDIQGSSAANPIQINGQNSSQVTLSHDQSVRNSTITLERVKHIEIKNLTIEATATSDAWGIHIFDSSHHISIDSNIITMPVGSNSDVSGIMISGSETSDNSSGSNGNYIGITNNEVIGGERGVSAYGSSSILNRALLIENNSIHSADDNGIYIYYYDSVAVRGNTIDNLQNTGSDALYMSDDENFEVSGNYLRGQDNGMDADDLNFNNPVSSNSFIFNNMFLGDDDGAYFDDCESISFYHNSFRGEDYGMYVNDHLNWDVRNNIFYSNSTYAFYNLDSLAITMDYNIYYTNGTNLIYFSGVYSDLTAFQIGIPSLNANSLQGDPMFAVPIDLHINGTLANDVGDNSVGISVDFDGDVRPLAPSTTVDIGADEFNPPTCPNVSALTTTTASPTSVSFSWTPGGSETEWQIEYGLTSFPQGTGTLTSVNTSPNTTISGLSPSTGYDFYVRAVCSVGDTSSWTFLPLSAFTTCSKDTLTFVDDFNSGTLSQCWTISSSTYVTIESTCDTRNNVMDINYTEEAITPVIKAAAAQSIEVGYYIGAGACINDPEDSEHFHVEYWDGTQWVLAKDYDGTWPQAFVWDSFVIPPGSFNDSLMVKFNMIDGTTDAWQIDSVVIKEGPSCFPPTNFTYTPTSTTSADLTWTSATSAPNAVVEYGAAGFTLGTGTQIVSTSTTESITGLTQNHAYEAYVKDSCAVGDTSTWNGPLVFGGDMIPCDDFDAYSPGNAASQSILINGWGGTVAGGGDAEYSTDYANSGTQSLKIHDSGTSTFSDVVAELDTYNSGKWIVAVDLYIPTSNGGYYNILHDYTPASQVWAIEVTLDSNGTATVEEGTNGTATIGTFSYNTGAWNTIENVIDLDNDTAYIRVNGVNTTVGWQFSLGSTNFGDQFNAMNFYSTAPTGQTPLIYFDNFCISEILPHYSIGTINTEDASGNADSVNVRCSISGTVVGFDRRGGIGYEFALVDLTTGIQEGITVFDLNDVSGYTSPTEGDSLLIFGSIDQFNGLTQFRPDSIVVLGSGTVPTADTATTLDETTESILIQMNGWILLDSSKFSGSYTMRMENLAGTDTVEIAIDSDSEISDSLAVVGNAWVIGDTICSLVGVGSQNDPTAPYLEEYQVFPSLYADVTVCKLFTGIQKVAANDRAINIFPNPTVGQFTVAANGLNNDNAIITVRDISGKVVLQDNIANSNSSFTKQYDLSGKAKGLYFISIIDGEERINQKLIVQ